MMLCVLLCEVLVLESLGQYRVEKYQRRRNQNGSGTRNEKGSGTKNNNGSGTPSVYIGNQL